MSTLGYTNDFKDVAFPLKERVPRSEYMEYELKAEVNIGNAAHPHYTKRRFTIFKLDRADKEMIAALVLKFFQACEAGNLRLTCQLSFAFARAVLRSV